MAKAKWIGPGKLILQTGKAVYNGGEFETTDLKAGRYNQLVDKGLIDGTKRKEQKTATTTAPPAPDGGDGGKTDPDPDKGKDSGEGKDGKKGFFGTGGK